MPKKEKTFGDRGVPCRGLCIEIEVKKINPKDSGMYQLGYKRCSICEKFIKCEKTRCPCCGTLVRNKPKQSHLRQKWQN